MIVRRQTLIKIEIFSDAKTITGPVENYLMSFQWNKVKYRADKPISELIDILQKVIHP